MKTNKILIIHTSNEFGGAEYSLLDLLKYFNKNCIDIHSVFYSTSKIFKKKLESLSNIHNIRVDFLKKSHLYKYFIYYIPLILLSNLKILHLIKRNKIRIIYCNTYRSLPYCIFIRFLSKAQIICHCRDNIDSKWKQKLIYILSNKCIAVSNFIMEQVPNHKNIKRIHNGVKMPSDEEYPVSTGWLHRKLNLLPSTKIICNIGQILPWKNQMDFIKVCSLLVKEKNNIHFLIIGNIVDYQYYQKLINLIAKLGISSVVSFIGPVDNIYEYIKEIDLLLHTAINEPFGRVIIEAGAISKCVISYNSGGASEVIKNGETGFLIEKGDITGMSTIANFLLTDNKLGKNIGKKAQEHIVKHYKSIDKSNKIFNFILHD